MWTVGVTEVLKSDATSSGKLIRLLIEGKHWTDVYDWYVGILVVIQNSIIKEMQQSENNLCQLQKANCCIILN
jgi:hypothetical protein